MLHRLKHTIPALIAGLLIAIGGPGASVAQTGATTAKPYTDADIAYGRTLQAKMDKERAESTGAIAKMPMEPFKVVGDLYFVGVHNFGVYLLKTPDGVIMLDTGWSDTEPLLEASMAKIGVKLSDVKIILTTEAHGDHNSAASIVIAKSGAKLMVMEGDDVLMQSGKQFPAVKVDQVLHDREVVKFGGKVLTPYHIPGHTPGSTTWYWQEQENGVTYNVADVCCWFTPTNVVNDPMFPTEQLNKNWEVLKSLPVDIPAPGIHTYHFDLRGKLEKKKAGDPSPFLDPQGYRGIIAAFEQDYKDKLAKQLKDGPPPARAADAPPPGPPKAMPFAVSDVRIFDGDKVIENETVLVADGKITGVGVKLEIPAGYTVIDGKGKTLMPGLIDPHVHMAESYFTGGGMVLEEATAYGVTTVLDMGVSEPNGYQVFKKKIKDNEFTTGADLFTAGVGATVEGGHGDMGHVNPKPASLDNVQAWVDARKAAGSDYIKIFSETFEEHPGRNVPTLSNEMLAAIIKATHNDGMLAVVHTLQEKRARFVAENGADVLVHISPYDMPSPDYGKFLAEHHVAESTNLISYAPVSYKQELAADPNLSQYMPKFMIDDLKNARLFPDSHHEYSIAGLKELIAAKVKIMAGTDIGYPYSPLLHAELEIMVKDGGMSPLEALKTVSSNPADVYKTILSDRGRIQPGLRADLLLVNGDPTKDILATRNIVSVWRQGALIDRDGLKAELLAVPAPKPMGMPGKKPGPPPAGGVAPAPKK